MSLDCGGTVTRRRQETRLRATATGREVQHVRGPGVTVDGVGWHGRRERGRPDGNGRRSLLRLLRRTSRPAREDNTRTRAVVTRHLRRLYVVKGREQNGEHTLAAATGSVMRTAFGLARPLSVASTRRDRMWCVLCAFNGNVCTCIGSGRRKRYGVGGDNNRTGE